MEIWLNYLAVAFANGSHHARHSMISKLSRFFWMFKLGIEVLFLL